MSEIAWHRLLFNVEDHDSESREYQIKRDFQKLSNRGEELHSAGAHDEKPEQEKISASAGEGLGQAVLEGGDEGLVSDEDGLSVHSLTSLLPEEGEEGQPEEQVLGYHILSAWGKYLNMLCYMQGLGNSDKFYQNFDRKPLVNSRGRYLLRAAVRP